MRILAFSACVTLLAGPAYGQAADSPPRFLAADVHPSRPGAPPELSGPFTSAGFYKIRFATMVDLIRLAYGVEGSRVLGGPNWLEFDRFELIAKAPASATPDALRSMLQALLAERFGLTVHKDSKPVPAFVLTVGKRKPQLKPSDGPGNDGCRGRSYRSAHHLLQS